MSKLNALLKRDKVGQRRPVEVHVDITFRKELRLIISIAIKAITVIVSFFVFTSFIFGEPFNPQNINLYPLWRLNELIRIASSDNRYVITLVLTILLGLPISAAALIMMLIYASKLLRDVSSLILFLGLDVSMFIAKLAPLGKLRVKSLTKFYAKLSRLYSFVLSDPFSVAYGRVTPIHRAYRSLVNVIVLIVALVFMLVYVILHNLIFSSIAAIAVGLLLYMMRYRIIATVVRSRGRAKTSELENELPYIVSLTSAIYYSGLNITTLFDIGSRLQSMPAFRKESHIVQRYTRMFTGHILTTLEKILEVHPSPLYRSFLNTLVTLERLGGEKYNVLTEFRNVVMRDLRSRAEAFIERLTMLSTFPLVFFMLLPMTLVVVMFLLAGVIPPHQLALTITALVFIIWIGMYSLVNATYVVEFTDAISASRLIYSSFLLAIIMALLLLPIFSPHMWLDISKSVFYATGLGQLLDSMIPKESMTPDRYASYATLLSTLLLLPFVLLALFNYNWFRQVQAINLSITDIMRAIADRARLGKTPRQALIEASSLGLSPLARRIIESIIPRLLVGYRLYDAIRGLKAKIGIDPPAAVRRAFELIDYMENIGVEPKAITVFADTLQQIYALRRDVARKVRNNVMVGMSFLIVAALMIVVIKVALIDQLIMLGATIKAPRVIHGMLAGFAGLLKLFKPLKPAEKLEALTLSYYTLAFSSMLLGAILGKIKDNNVISAAFYASLAAILILIVSSMIPFLQPQIKQVLAGLLG